MAYYPLSQIKTNLQTDGTEYQYLDGTPYKGFYYKISTGKYYTGKSPQSGQPQEIVEIPNVKLNSIPQTKQIVAAFKSNDIDPTILPEFQETQNIYSDYVALTSVPTSIQNPYYNPTYPTDEDYTIGEFRRYFVKRANNIIYIEIDKEQYDLIINKNPSIMFAMYIPFTLPWNISGDKNKVATTNENIVKLTSFRKKLPKLGDYLKNNYIKYYK